MKQKKKLAGILAAGMCTAAVFSGCGKDAKKEGGSLRLLLAVSEIDTFRQTFADEAKKAATEKGAVLDVVEAQNVIETQVSQIREAADSYDAVLCIPINIDTTRELKESAGELPVVFCNSCPEEKYLTKGKYVYVGSDEYTAGQYQAEYVLDSLSGKDEINVALLKGPTGHSATDGRTDGVKKTLAKSGKKINYVFEDHADWSQEKAVDLFRIFLQTGNKADCVICNNDSMALGVVEACKEAGADTSGMMVLGVDATADGCTAVLDGDMAFTVYQSGAGQGQAAVEAAIALASGNPIKDMEGVSDDELYVWVPFEKVDKGNAGKYAP